MIRKIKPSCTKGYRVCVLWLTKALNCDGKVGKRCNSPAVGWRGAADQLFFMSGFRVGSECKHAVGKRPFRDEALFKHPFFDGHINVFYFATPLHLPPLYLFAHNEHVFGDDRLSQFYISECIVEYHFQVNSSFNINGNCVPFNGTSRCGSLVTFRDENIDAGWFSVAGGASIVAAVWYLRFTDNQTTLRSWSRRRFNRDVAPRVIVIYHVIISLPIYVLRWCWTLWIVWWWTKGNSLLSFHFMRSFVR